MTARRAYQEACLQADEARLAQLDALLAGTAPPALPRERLERAALRRVRLRRLRTLRRL